MKLARVTDEAFEFSTKEYDDVEKHPRYSSKFQENFLVIDISQKIDLSLTYEIDLSAASISTFEGVNPNKKFTH